jgi:hypothetical protein
MPSHQKYMQLPSTLMRSEEASEPKKVTMTPCTGQKANTHKQGFTNNAKQTPPKKARYATPSGEWLGLRTEEGRSQPRKAPGKRMQL